MEAIKINSSKFKIFSLAFLTIFMVVSCDQNNDSMDTKEIAEDKNDDKFSDSKEDDSEYLVEAAAISLEEIKLGQLAQNKSSTPEVVELGKMMEKDHTKALEDIKSLAAKKNISVPTVITNDGQDAYDKLVDESGADFDKKYCKMMVDGHKDAIKKIEKAHDDTEDSDVRSWANSHLATLRVHLDHSEACQEKCEKRKS